MEPVILATKRLVLRPLAPSDAAAVHRACQDPDIQRWTSVPSPYTREHAEAFVGEICPAGWRDEQLLNFGSFTRDGDVLVSSIGLHTAKLGDDGTAEIGYWTAPEHRRLGYTAEAAVAVARWAFLGLGVQRLEWLAEVGNVASRAVAVKAGFTIEGLLRSRIVQRATRRDAWIGSLLASDLGLPEEPLPYLPHHPRSADL